MASEQNHTQTPGVRFMSRFPRFGHGSEFSKLASSEQEEQTDYAVGILAVSFFITSLLIFWAAVIITFKCMGKRRVGICAGRMRVKCDEKGHFRPPSYAWKLRLTFIIFGCWLILFCMALAGPGLASIKTTSVSIRKLNRDVNDLSTQGILILESVKRVKWNIDEFDAPLLRLAKEACPNLENNRFISDESLISSIKVLEKEFNQLKEEIKYIDSERIRQHIDFIMDGAEHIESAVTTFEENDWIVRMFALFLGGLTVFMIIAAFSAWNGIYRYLSALTCMLELFILPTFAIAIICCWIATSALAFASIFNSGNSQQSGPGGTVMEIFEERGITSNDMIFTAFTYYQSGCVTDDPIIQLYKYEDYLQNGIGSADQFLVKVNEISIDKINDQCGADVTPMIEGIGIMNDNLGILLDALRSTYELTRCSKLRPIYTQAFDETACTDSSGSFELLFLIMLAISLFGMVLVMLRAGMYPLKMVFPSSSLDEEENELEEYRAYLQYVSSFINSLGGNMAYDVALSPKASTFETSAESTSHSSQNSHTSVDLVVVKPSAPTESSSFYNAEDETESAPNFEGREKTPISSPDSKFLSDQSRMYTPEAKHSLDGDGDDECTPLTPQSPGTYHGGMRSRRLTTPDFLTPGTFRRWRRRDEEDGRSGEEFPETPLLISPKGHHNEVNYFSSFLSPLKGGRHQIDPGEDKSK